MEVFHGGFTIVPAEQARTRVASFVAGPSIPASTLRLQVLRVEAPSEGDRRLYAKTVQFAILNALSRNREIRKTPYSADMFVWVSPAGLVQDASFFTSTGNNHTDTAITNIVRTVSVGRSPPADLPQPVHVRILANAGNP